MTEIAADSAIAAPAGPSRWRVIRAAAAKEWTELRRDSRLVALFALVLLLLAGALAFGAAQHSRLDRERDAAAAADRALWVSQGAKNPHEAAHFGQFAFKPQSLLALADPGVDAYVGSAVRLEAHRQKHPQFRSASDNGVASRLGGLSFAFVLQIVMPLVAILIGFAAFAGERERGTLRQSLSVGASGVDLLAGKALAALAALSALLVPAFALCAAAIVLIADHDVSVADQLTRLAALLAGYALYLAGFVFLALAVSALARTTRAALVILLAFWLVDGFLAPRVMTDVVERAAPLPTTQQFQQAIVEEENALIGEDETHPAYIAFKEKALAGHGVSRIEDLPFNFGGLALRWYDETGFPIYDRHFAALQAAIDRQDRLRAAPGFLFPLLAAQPWSASLSGTDASHQHDFAAAAEAHRRRIQNMASGDLIANAAKGKDWDEDYLSSPELWAKVPSFDYRSPDASFALSHVGGDLAALALWAAWTLGFAIFAARRLRPV
jgi:ABC-2 type transport system permease protein